MDTPPVVDDALGGYAWKEEWAHHAEAPDQHWSHHGVAVTSAGDIVTCVAATGEVVVLAPDGAVRSRWPTGLLQAHGITIAGEGDSEVVWLSDPGMSSLVERDGSVGMRLGPPRVVAFSLTGEQVAELATPPVEPVGSADYRPTGVAVDEVGLGGSGDIWVADGYGAQVVHRYGADGTWRAVIDGSSGGGRFSCPHAVLIDRRRAEPELYVTDRGNARLQVYGLDGRFRRVVGAGVLNSPSALAVDGERLVVAELNARLAILDLSDALVGYVGEDAGAPSRPGWPNALVDGHTVRPPLRAGAFNSPHGLAVDRTGRLLVAEWLVGGRLPRLDPQP